MLILMLFAPQMNIIFAISTSNNPIINKIYAWERWRTSAWYLPRNLNFQPKNVVLAKDYVSSGVVLRLPLCWLHGCRQSALAGRVNGPISDGWNSYTQLSTAISAPALLKEPHNHAWTIRRNPVNGLMLILGFYGQDLSRYCIWKLVVRILALSEVLPFTLPISC